MNKIKVIHIDDDAKTLINSKEIFEANTSIDYKGGFSNAKEAIAFLQNEIIDLVFCDMEMPEHNGLWVANNLPYTVPIVFITAHSDFAIKAFDACALHYLMKPLASIQLEEVIERFQKQDLKYSLLKEQISQLYNQYLPQSTKALPTKIFINNIAKIIIVNFSELMYMEGNGNYTKFFMLSGEIHTSSKNLKAYEDAIIHHPHFVRIHRSFVINKNFIKQIVKLNTLQWLVEMKNEQKLEIAKGRLNEILEKIQD